MIIEPVLYGRFLPVDPCGFIENDRNITILQDKWKPLLTDLIDFFIQNEPRLHSIYLRGSVGDGRAVEGISDVDSMAVIDSDPQNPDSAKVMLKCDWIQEVNRVLLAKYLFCDSVETYLLPKPKILTDRRSAFYIQSQSLCIYGKDLIPEIAPFNIRDTEVLSHAPNLGYDIDYIKRKISENSDPDFVASCCKKIMKRIVRAGMELCIEDSRKYTRDLFLSVEVFKNYYTADGFRAEDAMHYALNPVRSAPELLQALEYTGDWMVKVIQKKFPISERKISFIDDFSLGDELDFPSLDKNKSFITPRYPHFDLNF